jgi:FkbM family methyltransferase
VQRSVEMVDRSLIFDVGCNDGQDSDCYLKKGFRVVAVEANPALCEGLRERFADEIAQGRFILVCEAIAEEAGEVEFYVNEKENIRSTIRPRACVQLRRMAAQAS